MPNPLMVFENIETTPRYKPFSVLGVPWLFTRYAWISPLLSLALGIGIATVTQADRVLISRVIIGVTYGMLIILVGFLHSFGHILSAYFVRAPMSALLITATRQVTLYSGPQDEYPRRVHLGRALGGPVMNIAVGIIALILTEDGDPMLGFFAVVNLLFGFGALIPVRSVDGEVIWRELRAPRSE